MTVGILILSHNQIGTELVNTARQMLSSCPLPTKVISIGIDDDPDHIRAQLHDVVEKLDQGNGILILTDMLGSTPSNVAYAVSEHNGVRIVSGLNLPMLIRVFNYPNLSLDELKIKALSGGQDGIVCCQEHGCYS